MTNSYIILMLRYRLEMLCFTLKEKINYNLKKSNIMSMKISTKRWIIDLRRKI